MVPSCRKIAVVVAFPMGSTADLKLRQERLPGMVTGFIVRPTGPICMVAWGDGSESNHFEIELTDTFEPTFDVDG